MSGNETILQPAEVISNSQTQRPAKATLSLYSGKVHNKSRFADSLHALQNEKIQYMIYVRDLKITSGKRKSTLEDTIERMSIT